MKKIVISLLAALSTSFTFAASQVNYLNVDGNAVHFSVVDAKNHTIPSCAVAETNQRYGVSLLTESGRAMYSMLITAMASKQAIDVKSANDCADVVGIERAEGVSISPIITQSSEVNGKAVYLYKGDSTTKLGRVVSIRDENSLYYLPIEDNLNWKTYHNDNANQKAEIRYSSTDCTGTALTDSYKGRHPAFEQGKFISSGSRTWINTRSMLSNNGSCSLVNKGGSYGIAALMQDPLCGDSPCIIKEE